MTQGIWGQMVLLELECEECIRSEACNLSLTTIPFIEEFRMGFTNGITSCALIIFIKCLSLHYPGHINSLSLHYSGRVAFVGVYMASKPSLVKKRATLD